MICEICGNNYTKSCAHCTRRVMVWGIDGTIALMEMAKETNPIEASRLLEFVNQYYVGKVREASDKANVLRIALKVLGFNAGFTGRIHKNGSTYLDYRRRENQTARRYRLRKDYCEKCGATENLAIHHIVPLSWGGTSAEENCITLCESCHRKTHKKVSALLNRAKLLEYLEPHKKEIAELAKSTV